MADVSLEMLQTLVQRVLDEQASSRREVGEMRREVGDIRTLVLAVSDQSRRTERRVAELDRRMSELTDDIELMVKAELMGRLGHFEIRIDRRLEAIEARLPV